MRPLIAALLVAALAGTGSAPERAQAGPAGPAAWPTKPLTLVVPSAGGSAPDVLARALAHKLGPLLGQAVIVDNRAGANGAIASEWVARARPDGHTLMLGYIATHAMNPALRKLKYHPVADFTPIGLVAYSPTLMVANAATPVTSVQDLVAQLKASPDKYSYATAGHGTAPHFAGELFKLSAGVVMLGVPYKGSAPALSDTIGGLAQFMFPSLFAALPHIRSGKLRALGVAGPARLKGLPDVPTLREAGVDGVDVSQWYAVFAPARTPRPVVDKLNQAFNAALADADLIKRLQDHGAEVQPGTPAQLARLVQDELAKWQGVVQAARLTAD